MVQKQEEMNSCGVNVDKVEAFTVSPQEKGRKNKRKLADPSQPNAASLTEFPPYELPSLKPQNHLSGNGLVGEVSNQLQLEESESVEWDDPFACQLEELLSSNLLTLFLNAMKELIDLGYTDDEVLKAISGSRLYCGGNNLMSNIVNNTLSVLKVGNEGAGSRDYVFEDLQQLVSYTLVEMVSLVKEVRPSLSTVEAMWRLLMCDLNVLQAFEVEGDGLVSSSKSSDSESLGAESNPPNSSDPDNPKPPQSNPQSNRNEPLKFGNFPNTPNSKKTQSSETTPGKEVCSGSTVSCQGMRSTSFTLVSDEKLVSCRKGRTKKEIAMLRQKSCVEKIRTYSKGSGYKAAKFASVGSFLLEKRVKSSSEFVARNSSSKITAEIGVKVSLAEDSGCFVRKNSKLDSPVVMVDAKGYITALPARSVKSASKKKSGSESVTLIPSASEKKSDSSVPSASEKKSDSSVPSASEKKSGSKSEEKASVSAKLAPDYYAGIPYDAALGIYVPRDKKDELILKLVPRVNDLQNEMQVWTDWANQKVKEATGRLLKDQPELKATKERARRGRTNATSQLEKAHNTARRLELEQSLLKKEMEAAKIKAVESAESCREAKERGQRSLKDTHSWEGQKILLQEELKGQRDKVAVLQKELPALHHMSHLLTSLPFIFVFLAALKQERTAKGKLSAQASLIKKETKELEALGKVEEERIKGKAETDVKYYKDNIKRLEREISELKLKSDYSRIVALKKGSSAVKGHKKRESWYDQSEKRKRMCDVLV
ncbi:unnamed protein product [Arabidopsis arenosa]|uniref:PIR2-like helical domain-containing protein n=1 Tax=Arabidopsis arenosa TaxID=38785 RepID=A0A8S1ZBC6_ARAAE|nr:unnamed protein product [Arabidopsis arenosa]